MNVIWIISDTLRRDHLGCYGNPTIHTPSLDAFAEKSVRFDRHYMAGFPTMPARADYYTGRWTSCFMGWGPIPRGQLTLPYLLRKNFHTAAVVDTPFYVRDGCNYDMGFDSFYEIPGQQGYGGYGPTMAKDERNSRRFEADHLAPKTFTKAMEWLEEHYKEDFFLYIDAWDPHEPWDAPAYYTELYYPDYDGEQISAIYARWQDVPGLTEEMVKKAHACYCGEVTMVDTWVGRLLRHIENLNLMEKTAIIFVTDHGYYFGEHGGILGKFVTATAPTSPFWMEEGRKDGKDQGEGRGGWARSPLFEELAACPLMIYVPGVEPGAYGGLTSAIDLMPTVLDVMGQDIPDVVEGQSLLPMMKDTGLKGREYVISTHPFANVGQVTKAVDGRERKMLEKSDTTITTDEWSLLYSPEPGNSWLYHLPSDPKQEKNVIDQYPEKAKELHQLLIKFMNDYNLPAELRDQRLEL